MRDLLEDFETYSKIESVDPCFWASFGESTSFLPLWLLFESSSCPNFSRERELFEILSRLGVVQIPGTRINSSESNRDLLKQSQI